MNLIGLTELADVFGVRLKTVHQWRTRRRLPDPDLEVGGRPAWRRTTIERWAKATGRKMVA